MKPPSPRDVQTDTHSPNRRETASEQTVIIGEGGGGVQNILAGAAATPPPPKEPAKPAPQSIAPDPGVTRLLPYPGSAPAADPVMKSAPAPVVGWLVIVDGPGKGNFRPIFPGSNTIGRAASQRIPLDFGDDTISSEKQAFLVYDGRKRHFQIVPNLERSNLVHLNDSALLSNSELKPHDKIMVGNTTLLFVPLCGPEFDWGGEAAK